MEINFQTRSHCAALTNLKLSVWTKLALNLLIPFVKVYSQDLIIFHKATLILSCWGFGFNI